MVMICGSVVAAAERLNITQPSVSKILSQLQMSCGIELFNKVSGRLVPTKKAQDLWLVVRDYYLALNEVNNKICEIRKGLKKNIRIGCTQALSLEILPEITRIIYEKYGDDLNISLSVSGSENLYSDLRFGKLDFILTTSSQKSSWIKSDMLHTSERVLVTGRAHRLSAKNTISLSELNGESIIVLSPGDKEFDLVTELMDENDVHPGKFIGVSNSSIACALVAREIGISIVNKYVASFNKNFISIKTLPIKSEVSINIDYLRKSELTFPQKIFLIEIKNYFADYHV